MFRTALIVDDDSSVVESLCLWLEREGCKCFSLSRGDMVLDWLAANPVDIIVLDVMLPGKDGVTCCLEIQSTYPYLPVLMLSARDDLMDKIIGLESGADDYMSKPFHPKEVLSRIRAIFRRQHQKVLAPDLESELLVRGRLKLDRQRYRATIDDKLLNLTTTEFCLLRVLAERPGHVFHRTKLLDLVWGDDFVGSERTIDSHIRNLRRKLEAVDQPFESIRSVRGVGYSFEA